MDLPLQWKRKRTYQLLQRWRPFAVGVKELDLAILLESNLTTLAISIIGKS